MASGVCGEKHDSIRADPISDCSSGPKVISDGDRKQCFFGRNFIGTKNEFGFQRGECIAKQYEQRILRDELLYNTVAESEL